MATFKITSTGNIVVADQAFMDAKHPGDYMLVPDATTTSVKSWLAYDFYRLFTPAERIAIRALGNTDPVAFDFLHTLEMTIASSGRVVATDPDLIAGMAYLQAQPSASPILTAARAAVILGA